MVRCLADLSLISRRRNRWFLKILLSRFEGLSQRPESNYCARIFPGEARWDQYLVGSSSLRLDCIEL